MSTTPVLHRENASPAASGAASTLVCLPSLSVEALEATLSHLSEALGDRPVVVSSPDAATHSMTTKGMQLQQYIPPAPSQASWVPTAADYLNAWTVARNDRPQAILILGSESAAISPGALRRLADTARSGQDLVVPRYTVGPHDALVNSSILYPLSNALFVQPVRFPLPIDVALSSRLAERLATAAQRHTAAGHGEALIWPVAEAAVAGHLIREVEGDARILPQPSADNLNSVLATVAGSLFADLESKAAFWQRARLATQAPPNDFVQASPSVDSDPEPVNLAPMMEAFRNAYTNLRELWSLVLPPNSLLSLKKLSVAATDDFHMSDALWARTVYDFLLAYRLRTINRGHLLGAFTPLYLAWVASHLKLVHGDAALAEEHIHSVAAAFHADKPYLVARWRWPDRFNP